jgi:hypothetical protein
MAKTVKPVDILGGPQWEYIKVVSPSVEEMNTLGHLGWELVCILGNFFYFKRELLG